MNAIRIKRYLDSGTLQLPELQPMVGRNVEIIILEDFPSGEPSTARPAWGSLKGSVLKDEDPCEPVAAEDWEALQ